MNRILVFTCCLCGLLSVGCGGGSGGRADVFPVSGTVKYNGSPVIGAFVSFTPRDGQPAATSRTDDNGRYQLTTYESGDGAAVGSFAVIVMKYDTGTTAAADPEAGHSTDVNARMVDGGHDAKGKKKVDGGLLPPAYAKMDTTPLAATVSSAGGNLFDFDLQ